MCDRIITETVDSVICYQDGDDEANSGQQNQTGEDEQRNGKSFSHSFKTRSPPTKTTRIGQL
jgi:hypothetical protein